MKSTLDKSKRQKSSKLVKVNPQIRKGTIKNVVFFSAFDFCPGERAKHLFSHAAFTITIIKDAPPSKNIAKRIPGITRRDFFIEKIKY